MVSAALSFGFWSHPQFRLSDFGMSWTAARVLLSGQDPYVLIGPGRAIPWEFRLMYPLTAVLVAVPFTALRLRQADPLFVACATGLLTWVLTRRRINDPRLLVLLSLPYLYVIQTSQWSPLLVGAALVPAVGFLLACKPTIGAALFAAFPHRATVIGCVALAVLSVFVKPTWIREWLATLPSVTHIRAPVTLPGGFLVLLGGIKWRRPEARLLVALACVPQTIALYETVPLFLIPSRWSESWALWALAIVAYLAQGSGAGFSTYDAYFDAGGRWIVWLMSLPCTLLVLTRPNVWPPKSDL
jgi:hypothetical protein